MEKAPRYSLTQATPFGPLGVLCSIRRERPVIHRILLPAGSGREAFSADPPGLSPPPALSAAMDGWMDRLVAILAGDPAASFPLEALRLEDGTAFQWRVLRTEATVPRGFVTSYGLLAEHLGCPGAARAVGQALASNPFPIAVPCHRAIRSDGTLGGYAGGVAMKRRLLDAEGVRFESSGRGEARVVRSCIVRPPGR